MNQNSAEGTPSAASFRVRPTVAIGVAVYLGYLAIFYTTWAIKDVDYETIGESLESTKLHYAYPTLFGCAFVAVAVSVVGWWRITLFDKSRVGPKWVWIGPALMVLTAAAGFATVDTDHPEFSSTLVAWSLLGAIGVGFGEEMITRGTLLVGLRSRYSEWHVWLYSTLLFSALHIPNVIFGLNPGGAVFQLINTFIFGTFLYGVRRFSGTLIVPMILHGVWDSSQFLPVATDSDGTALPVLIIPLMIVIGYVMVKQNNGLRLGLDGAIIETAEGSADTPAS